MNCDQKSLRDLLGSAFSLSAVESVLKAVQNGEEVTVNMESGEVVSIKDSEAASEFLVDTGCAARLVQQVQRAIDAGPYMHEIEMKRLSKHWEKVRARHVLLMQEAFRVSHGLQAAKEKLSGIGAKKRTLAPKSVTSSDSAASPKLKRRYGT
jgi:hypothetical protein